MICLSVLLLLQLRSVLGSGLTWVSFPHQPIVDFFDHLRDRLVVQASGRCTKMERMGDVVVPFLWTMHCPVLRVASQLSGTMRSQTSPHHC
jgi:hypothetical protein